MDSPEVSHTQQPQSLFNQIADKNQARALLVSEEDKKGILGEFKIKAVDFTSNDTAQLMHDILGHLLLDDEEWDQDRRDAILEFLPLLPFNKLPRRVIESYYLEAISKLNQEHDTLGPVSQLIQAGQILAPHFMIESSVPWAVLNKIETYSEDVDFLKAEADALRDKIENKRCDEPHNLLIDDRLTNNLISDIDDLPIEIWTNQQFRERATDFTNKIVDTIPVNDERVVGYHGMSLETLIYFLQNGHIPGTTLRDNVDYGPEEPGSLYFEGGKRLQKYLNRSYLKLEDDIAIDSVKGYAEGAASRYYICAKLGLDITDIDLLDNLYRIDRQELAEEFGIPIDLINQTFEEADSRKGFLLGINDSILDRNNYQIEDGPSYDYYFVPKNGVIDMSIIQWVVPLGKEEENFINQLKAELEKNNHP